MQNFKIKLLLEISSMKIQYLISLIFTSSPRILGSLDDHSLPLDHLLIRFPFFLSFVWYSCRIMKIEGLGLYVSMKTLTCWCLTAFFKDILIVSRNILIHCIVHFKARHVDARAYSLTNSASSWPWGSCLVLIELWRSISSGTVQLN